jgi:hypothetical protein
MNTSMNSKIREIRGPWKRYEVAMDIALGYSILESIDTHFLALGLPARIAFIGALWLVQVEAVRWKVRSKSSAQSNQEPWEGSMDDDSDWKHPIC